MPRSREAAATLALVVVLFLGGGCGRQEPPIEVGRHRVHVELPRGWERLDHGRQQLFRQGEAQFVLEDLGPASRDALAGELREAQRLWRAGSRPDALQRVRDLRGPALHFADSEQRAAFWRPWTDATYSRGQADSLQVEAALAALIAGLAALPGATPADLREYVLALTADLVRNEVATETGRTIHGSAWVVLELWDRVSHRNRSRVALLEIDGHLLVLRTDMGPIEMTGPAFEAVLASLMVVARAPGMR